MLWSAAGYAFLLYTRFFLHFRWLKSLAAGRATASYYAIPGKGGLGERGYDTKQRK
jgi:hypothetical protein